MTGLTLVLGGGGVWGVAWMTGVLRGLQRAGVDLGAQAEKFIGTSAGSIVGAQLASGLSLPSLFQQQTDADGQSPQRMPASGDIGELSRLLQETTQEPEQRARVIGAIALKAQSISYAQRRAEIAERLGVGDSWPAKNLVTTAVNCDTGALHTFDAQSGVGLFDAIAASCAVPGIWPVVELAGKRFMDGGVWRTSDNAHLAEGASRIVILSPVGALSAAAALLQSDVVALQRAGATCALVTPNDASKATIALGMLDPKCRKPTAEAGQVQGQELGPQIDSVLRCG